MNAARIAELEAELLRLRAEEREELELKLRNAVWRIAELEAEVERLREELGR